MNSDSKGASFVVRRFAIFFLAGSFVNDLVLLEAVTPLSLAKLLFALGFSLLLLFGLSVRRLAMVDGLAILYAGGVVLLSALPHGGYANDYAASIALSLVIGLVAHLVISFLSREDLNFFLSCYVVWMLFSAALGVTQALSGVGYISDRAFSSIVIPGIWRAAGLSSDPNYFALMCLMAIVVLNSVLRWQRGRWPASLILSIAIFLSGSRAGILVYALIGSLWLFSAFRFSMAMKALAAVVGITTLLWLVSLNPAIGLIFEADNYTASSERTSLQDRGLLAALAVEVISESPWIGAGLGGVRAHEMNTMGSVSHNAYLELWAESGLLGLTLWLALLGVIYRKLKTFYSTESRLGAHWLVIVFMLMSVTLVTSSSRLFFLVSGVASALAWHAVTKIGRSEEAR